MEENEEETGYHFEAGDTVDELEASYSYQNTTFLKVLCILTWVYTLVVGFFFLRYFGNAKNLAIFSNGFGDNMNTEIVFRMLVFPVVCSFGAVLMFMRYRVGYLVYLLGQIPPIALTVYHFYIEMDMPEEMIPVTILYNAVPIGFVIMYATQLYLMKPIFKRREKTEI